MFLSYKVSMHDHAARLLQAEVGSKLLSKLRRKRAAKGAEPQPSEQQGSGAPTRSREILKKTESMGGEQLLAATQKVGASSKDGAAAGAGNDGNVMSVEELMGSSSPGRS